MKKIKIYLYHQILIEYTIESNKIIEENNNININVNKNLFKKNIFSKKNPFFYINFINIFLTFLYLNETSFKHKKSLILTFIIFLL